jgi:translation elongation factor EF-1beta
MQAKESLIDKIIPSELQISTIAHEELEFGIQELRNRI